MFNKYELKVVDKPAQENLIKAEEIDQLEAKEIADKLFSVCQRVESAFQALEKNILNPEDFFTIQDDIYLVNRADLGVIGASKQKIKIELAGKLKDLATQYQAAFQEKVASLELDPEALYAIDDWKHDSNIFDQSETEINENTKLKTFSFKNFISNGNLFQ